MCEAKNPLGVEVVDYYPWDDPPNACCIVEMPDENVADSLSETFKRWCYGQPIMITGPTGSGKPHSSSKSLGTATRGRLTSGYC